MHWKSHFCIMHQHNVSGIDVSAVPHNLCAGRMTAELARPFAYVAGAVSAFRACTLAGDAARTGIRC